MSTGNLSDYRLITVKVIHAFDTLISQSFQTMSHYDFHAFDIRPIIKYAFYIIIHLYHVVFCSGSLWLIVIHPVGD